MISGKQNILNWFDHSDCCYVFLYQYGKSDSGNYVWHSNLMEGATHAKAREELEAALKMFQGRYDIAATQTNKRSPKGDWRESIEIDNTGNNGITGMQAAQSVTGLSQDDVKNQIAKALAEYKTEQELIQLRKELAELRKENKELERAANEPLNKIAGIVAPMLGPMLAAGQAQVAGIPTPTQHTTNNDHLTAMEEEQTLTPEQEERLSIALGKLSAADPAGWLDKLCYLADKIEAKPSLLNMIGML